MNILYTGTSIIEIERIIKAKSKPQFLSKYFSPQEMKFLMGKHFAPQVIAESFCAKLAFARAMGYNFRGCHMNEVSVLMDVMDTPYISLSGVTKQKFAAKNCNMTVSVSHCKAYATAVVVFFSKN